MVLSVACCSALLAGGCESPFNQRAYNAGWDSYAQSVLAHQVSDGQIYNVQKKVTPVDQGVHEAAMGSADTGGALIPAAAPVRAAQASGATLGKFASALYQGEPIYRLTLQDAVAMALEHSLAIKVQAYNPAISQALLVQAQAAFDATLFGSTGVTRTDVPTTSGTQIGATGLIPGAGNSNNLAWDNQVGISKSLGWGGTAQFSATNDFLNVSKTPGFQPDVNPSNADNLALAISQPLLRGFGSDVVQSGILIARTNKRISLAAFRSQVQAVLKNIETTYYQLVLADANLRIQKRLFASTRHTLSQIQKRGIFDATSVQVAQAQDAVAQSRVAVITAQSNLRNASDDLKSLINDPELNLRGNVLLVPTDKPITEPIMFNVAQEISTALDQRSIMREDLLKLHESDINVRVAANQLLPDANLTLSTQSNGLSSAFGNAFTQTISPARFWSYAAGVQVSIPIGNRAAEAGYREQRLLRRQELTQMLLDAQNVILAVKTALRALLSSYQQIQAQRQARIAAGQVLAALDVQQQVGVSLTPEFLNLKLTAEQNLASAQAAELQAMINYSQAIVNLQAAKGTLLSYDQVRIEPVPFHATHNTHAARFVGKSY
jgi:outer membrane protein TolC